MADSKLFLKNQMEDSVWSFMDDVLARYPETCHCATCRMDVAAVALNYLPPRYVVREKGEVLSKAAILADQYRADIYSALTRAVMVVQQQPRHNGPDA